MIATGSLETYIKSAGNITEMLDEMIMIDMFIGDLHTVMFFAWFLDQDIAAKLGYFNGYKNGRNRSIVKFGRDSMPPIISYRIHTLRGLCSAVATYFTVAESSQTTKPFLPYALWAELFLD